MRRRARSGRHVPPGATRRYFTDGGRLYRFIDWMARPRKSMLAAVEDCQSLEILLVSAEHLRTWREVSRPTS